MSVRNLNEHPREPNPHANKGQGTRFRWRSLALTALLVVIGYLLFIIIQLPDIQALHHYTPFEATKILDANGKIIAMLHQEENRTIVRLADISPQLQRAVIASEDNRFFEHHGIDTAGMMRAFFSNLIHLEVQQGGSTLTQQLAKNLLLNPRRTLQRKISEIFLALNIEHHFTKEEILEFYLNQVYWGHNAYGIQAAAQLYFGKAAKDLDLAESALLAGLLSLPEIYTPYRNPHLAKEKQTHVLSRMELLGLITHEEFKAAKAKKIELVSDRPMQFSSHAPYFVSYILSQLREWYGDELIYTGGLEVKTSLDLDLQKAAETAVLPILQKEGKKFNFHQVAFLAMEPSTGYIRAMIGGANFEESQYNRTVQSKRQPGSSFKPFVYTAAIEKGFGPYTPVYDGPVSYPTAEGPWRPLNYDRRFHGTVPLRVALAHSYNIPAIKTLEKIGIDSAIEMAKRLGIESPLSPNLSLALGVSEVSVLEMVRAYSSFANGGYRIYPISIVEVRDRNHNLLQQFVPTQQKVLEERVAAGIVDMMQDVIRYGTGWQANIGRPAAAKTGTTEEYRDAWFVGFVPQLVAGIWVGNDNNTSMQGVAEVAICPRMWKAFMQKALQNTPPTYFSFIPRYRPTPASKKIKTTTPRRKETEKPKPETTVVPTENKEQEPKKEDI